MHNVFEQIQFNIPVLKEVMDTKRDPYPNEIYYNTESCIIKKDK